MIQLKIAKSSILNPFEADELERLFDKNDERYKGEKPGGIFVQVKESKCEKYIILDGDFLEHETAKKLQKILQDLNYNAGG